MKRFTIKLFCFLIIFLTLVIAIVTAIDYTGYSDAYYKRFTSGNHTSLILGTSRAAQAIQPQIIDSILIHTNLALPCYNFAFTVSTSPYGEIYYNAIYKKLDTTSKNGLFILCVDPFSLSVDTTDYEWDKNSYREKNYYLNKIHLYTKPCYEYLLKFCEPHKWISNKHEILHNNGWLEITPPSMDSLIVAENIKRKMEDYNKRKISKSEYRIKWLESTITLLQQHGDIYLCRIPVSYEMQTLEDNLWRDFDKDIISISNKHGIPYYSFALDYNQYQTTDGNHLYKVSGAKFSKVLADSIAKIYYRQ